MLRPSELVVLAVVIELVTWLNMPGLLAPAFVVTLSLLSAYRWHLGLWPWPPRWSVKVTNTIQLLFIGGDAGGQLQHRGL